MRFITVICALWAFGSIVNVAPVIVERGNWGADEANIALMHIQIPHAIIVHHTGELRNYAITLGEKLRGLQDFSMRPHIITETKKEKPAWGDVPYHFYIDAHGRTGEGRAIQYAGDTNTGYDTSGYIQIVVEGHFDKEKPNVAQLKALDALVLWLVAAYHISPDNISGHNDHADTDCPGKYLKPHLDVLRRKISGST